MDNSEQLNQAKVALKALKEENAQLRKQLTAALQGKNVSESPLVLNETHESLIAKEQSYRTLLLNLPGMVYRCKNDKNWTMVLLNDGVTALTAYPKNDFLEGRVFYSSLIHPEDRKKVWDDIQSSLAENQAFELSYRIIDAFGKLRWVWERGRRITDVVTGNTYLEGLILDITSQKNSELQIERSELKFRTFFNQIRDAIFVFPILPDRFGTFEEINHIALNLLAYSAEEMATMSFTDICPDVVALENWSRKLGNKNPLVFECRLRAKDGSFTDCEISAQIFIQDEQKMIIAVARDIRDRKRQLEQLRLAMEKAKEADRLKSAFLSNISHEIRTPLNSIIGFSDVLEKGDFDPDSMKEFASIIKNSGHMLLSVVTDIVEIAQIESKQININNERLSILDLLLEVMTAFQPLAKKKGIKLISQIPTDIPDFFSDPFYVRKIIDHLLANAIKYTTEGSVHLSCSTENNKVLINVSDTGPGIESKDRANIFELFYRATNNVNITHSGTGLGLSISRGLARLMGGDLYYVPLEPNGSEFVLVLPFDELKLNPSDMSLENNSDPSKKSRILIADDLEVNFVYLKELVRSLNAEIVHAWNGQEVVDVIGKMDFDLILMDVRMPVLNGIDALKQVKQNKPDLPVIVQTAYASEGEGQKYLDMGFDGFLAKPVRRNQLLQEIGRFIS